MSLNLMKVAVLTAALQQIVTREEQTKNPLLPVLKWLDLAKKLGCDGIQLAAALHPDDSYVPPEAMLDPVADHLPLRQELSDADAAIIIAKSKETGVKIFDLGVFEDLLHQDPAIRAKIHAHVLRAARAAVKLREAGCEGVAGFIGRNTPKDMDQQLPLFEEQVIPLLLEFKKLGLTYWVEPCPMPGWNTTDAYINNIGYCAGLWIALYKICKKYGVEDVLRVTYDESHDILMGNSHHGSFSAMKAAGLPFMVNRFHGKDQVANPAKLAVWGYRGQTVLRGDRKDGKPDPDPRKQCNAWGVMTCGHGLPGLVHYNPENMAARRQVDWLDHQLAARRILGLDAENTVFIIEHEWFAARKQDPALVEGILSASVRFIKGVDQAAAATFQAETEICPAFALTMPSTPNPMYDIPGLEGTTAIDPLPALAAEPTEADAAKVIGLPAQSGDHAKATVIAEITELKQGQPTPGPLPGPETRVRHEETAQPAPAPATPKKKETRRINLPPRPAGTKSFIATMAARELQHTPATTPTEPPAAEMPTEIPKVGEDC